jgi:hypothetical protein
MPALPFKLSHDCRHHVPKQKKVVNWREYEASLCQRGSLTVWFSDTAIEGWRAVQRPIPGRQPWCSPLAILTALTLRAVFRLALRQTEGLVGVRGSTPGPSSARAGSGGARPHHPLPSGRDAGGAAATAKDEAIHLLGDSIGLKLCDAGEWLLEKHGTKTRRSWRKLHIGRDADTGQIVAAALTTNDVDDGSQVGPLLDQVATSVTSFTAEGAYDQEGVAAAVAERHPEQQPSCRRAPRPCQASRLRTRQRSETAICRASPSADERLGRRRPATPSAPASKPPSAGASR